MHWQCADPCAQACHDCRVWLQVDYIALGRLVALIQSTKPPGTKFRLKPKFITWIFFGLELASLACQGAGESFLCLRLSSIMFIIGREYALPNRPHMLWQHARLFLLSCKLMPIADCPCAGFGYMYLYACNRLIWICAGLQRCLLCLNMHRFDLGKCAALKSGACMHARFPC